MELWYCQGLEAVTGLLGSINMAQKLQSPAQHLKGRSCVCLPHVGDLSQLLSTAVCMQHQSAVVPEMMQTHDARSN